MKSTNKNVCVKKLENGAMDSLAAQMMRGDIFASACPARGVLRRMTSSWSVLVLIALRQDRTLRFGALRARIGGISERMLIQTLKGLEADGLVDRRSFDTIPPQVEYCLTPLGLEASEKVADIAEWVEANIASFSAMID